LPLSFRKKSFFLLKLRIHLKKDYFSGLGKRYAIMKQSNDAGGRSQKKAVFPKEMASNFSNKLERG